MLVSTNMDPHSPPPTKLLIQENGQDFAWEDLLRSNVIHVKALDEAATCIARAQNRIVNCIVYS